MKPIARALDDATRQLIEASDTSRLDAELLMAEALHIDRDRLLLKPPDRQVPERFWDMVRRRSEGEPVAYITGRRAFWDIELHVGSGVLVPRPDSEVLIASAIEHFAGKVAPGGSSISGLDRERCSSPLSTSGQKRPGSGSIYRGRPSLMLRQTLDALGSRLVRS